MSSTFNILLLTNEEFEIMPQLTNFELFGKNWTF